MSSRSVTPTFNRSRLAIAITTALSFSPSLLAESLTSDSRSELDTLYVIGEATSGIDNLVSSDDIEKSQANSLGELFKHDPNVSAGGTVAMSQKLYVRNIGEDLLNISVDGAEQAGPIFHHAGRVTLEPELLKQVEVESGAGSATAGFGALGGSIRFVTKDPEDLLKEGQNLGALIKSTYSTNGEGFKNSITVYGKDQDDQFSGMVSLLNADHDNAEDGDGNDLEGTESNKKLGYAKFIVNLTDEQTLSISHENLEEKGDIPYRPEWHQSTSSVLSSSAARRETTILNYDFSPKQQDLVNLSVNLYQTDNEQERFSSRFDSNYIGNVESTGLTVKNTSFIDQNELIYGVDYRKDESSLEDNHEEGRAIGVFVQDIFELNDKTTITAGARFDSYDLDDIDGQNLSDSGVSPNISGHYQLTPEWAISAGYAQALRGVTVHDAFDLDDYDNDSDLKAETSKNTEIAVNYDKGGLSVVAGAYQTRIEDLIAPELPWSDTFMNLEDDIKADGQFVRAQYAFDKLTLGASLLTSETKVNGVDATRYVYGSSAVAIGDTITLEASYQFAPSFDAGWNMVHVRGIDDIHFNLGGQDLSLSKPGYTVHDIYARWRPAKIENLTLNLTVSNLFDEQYLDHASVEDFTENSGYGNIIGTTEAGRNIRLSAAYQF
ncbi:TonB-dependent receptor domain-containing protein [Marinomonas epiphytica]